MDFKFTVMDCETARLYQQILAQRRAWRAVAVFGGGACCWNAAMAGIQANHCWHCRDRFSNWLLLAFLVIWFVMVNVLTRQAIRRVKQHSIIAQHIFAWAAAVDAGKRALAEAEYEQVSTAIDRLN